MPWAHYVTITAILKANPHSLVLLQLS